MSVTTCLITGATSGIGKAAAVALCALGWDLVLIGRDEYAGARLARSLQTQAPTASIEFIKTDLSSQAEVRRLAAQVAHRYARLDVLINNAGARFDTYHESLDGIELTFATNHLSHFLLTGLLLEQLQAAPAARVVTVTSEAHSGAPTPADWTIRAANFDRRRVYAQSKLANVMFAYELARRFEGTRATSNAVAPGNVATNFARNNGLISWARHLVGSGLRGRLSMPRAGAEGLVYLAASEQVAGISGKYFNGRHVSRSSDASLDRHEWERLWTLSRRLTGLTAEPADPSREQGAPRKLGGTPRDC
jgi:NAD(P)-dependent dehydrogenase (short-subunit alcohol dehydrogenase family)